MGGPVAPDVGDGVGRAFAEPHQHLAPDGIGGGRADRGLRPVEDDQPLIIDQNIVDVEVAVEELIAIREASEIIGGSALEPIRRRAIFDIGLKHGLHGAQSGCRATVHLMEEASHVPEEGGRREGFLANCSGDGWAVYLWIDKGAFVIHLDVRAGCGGGEAQGMGQRGSRPFALDHFIGHSGMEDLDDLSVANMENLRALAPVEQQPIASHFQRHVLHHFLISVHLPIAQLMVAAPTGFQELAQMKELIAFDLDGTLAESKQPLGEEMGEALADLMTVAHVAVISGGDWPQFDKQVASRLPSRADLSRLWLMPTTGTKLFTHQAGAWTPVYAELFDEAQKQNIFAAFDQALEATGFVPEETWGERIEDRGSQITFSALGQQAPIHAKEGWDPDFAKRRIIQADLRERLPGLSINMGGATSIDITREGVDKAYGLKKLRDASGIALDAMMFIGDAIFPGGNDYPAKELGLDTVRVRDPEETLSVIAAIVSCQK